MKARWLLVLLILVGCSKPLTPQQQRSAHKRQLLEEVTQPVGQRTVYDRWLAPPPDMELLKKVREKHREVPKECP